MITNTINATYEYRIANIVKLMMNNKDVSYIPTNGDELEEFLESNKDAFALAVLDDIEEWMGFDELFKQIKA